MGEGVEGSQLEELGVGRGKLTGSFLCKEGSGCGFDRLIIRYRRNSTQEVQQEGRWEWAGPSQQVAQPRRSWGEGGWTLTCSLGVTQRVPLLWKQAPPPEASALRGWREKGGERSDRQPQVRKTAKRRNERLKGCFPQKGAQAEGQGPW